MDNIIPVPFGTKAKFIKGSITPCGQSYSHLDGLIFTDNKHAKEIGSFILKSPDGFYVSGWFSNRYVKFFTSKRKIIVVIKERK